MENVKRKKIIKIFIFIGIIIAIIFVGQRIWEAKEEADYKARKPQGNYSANFLYQETFYSCSAEIRGNWEEARVGNPGGRGYYFVPESKSDIDKYCRMGAVIEYRAVLDILKKDDVRKTIEKYDTSQAWVRALGHTYINDKEYLHRILPKYADIQIDCIIVVHSPEGTRFFIENAEKHDTHDDHQYLEISSTEFLESLNKAPSEDVTNFWLALH